MTATTTVVDDRPVLGSIVGDPDHFMRCVFGQGPWRGHARCAGRLFGIDDVDRIVSSAVRVPAIRMIRDGERVDADEFCTPTRIGSVTLDDVADARKTLDLFRGGSTLVLQSLHRLWSPLSEWCATLEREIGWPVQANAYLTPQGQRGLAPHADTHDVLAIQLHGSKGWNVEGLGDFDLDVGDTLYLPAGLTHSAETDGRSSLHLTVGIHRPGADRIARRATAIALERTTREVGAHPDASVHSLRSALGDVDGDEVLDRLRRSPRTHAGGLLSASIRREFLDENTLIEANGCWALDTQGDRVVLTWDGGQLWLPGKTAPSLRLLCRGNGPVPIDRLPGLDPSERLVLARRLLDEGAATTHVASIQTARHSVLESAWDRVDAADSACPPTP